MRCRMNWRGYGEVATGQGQDYSNRMNKVLRDQVMRLPAEERLELIGELWDSLDSGGLPPLTAEQMKEIDRRMAEYERDPSRGIPLDEFLARLESRFG